MNEGIKVLKKAYQDEARQEGIQKGIQEGIQKGEVKGSQKKENEIVINLLDMDMPIPKIHQATKMPIPKIQEIQRKHMNK